MSNYKDDLTQDEQILHHHAARLKQNLEAYHACTDRDEETWTKVFSALLRKSMNYFVETKERSPNHLRIHPLFLSLTAAFTKSAKSPDIGSVSENDPRVLNNQYYTSSSDLPPLDIHFPGQNMVGLCQECMVSEPQVNAGARTVEPSTSLPVIDAEPILPEPGDNTAGASDPTNNIHGKGKKRRRASSGTVNRVYTTRSAATRKAVGDDVEVTVGTRPMEVEEDTNVLCGPLNTRSRKVARLLQDRAKGKLARTGFQNTARPGARNRGKQKKMGARTSTSTPSAKEANEAWKDVPSLAQKHLAETGEDKNQKGMLGEDEETVHDLKMEVQTLKGRCDEHEKKIDDLESRCDTHERVIEMLRQEIVGLKDSQNTLSTAYHGERYDMIP